MILRMCAIALALLAAGPIAGYAGDAAPRPISLEEALGIALRENRALRAAGLSARAAEDEAAVARGAMLPRLDTLENFSYSNNPVQVFSSLLAQQEFGASNFAVDKLNHPAFLSNFQSQARLSFPLFAGGRLLASYRAAGFGADAERWQSVRARQQTEFAVIQSYYAALLADRRTTVVQRALAAARAHLSQAQDLFAHGIVVNSDVLRSKVLEGTVEQQRLESDSEAAIARAGLAHVLGQEDQGFAPVEASLAAGAGAEPPALEVLVQSAATARPEIKIADARVRQAREAVTIARAEYLPTVEVAGVYENDSQRLTRAGNSGALMVTGQLNLFSGMATHAKVDAAQAQMSRAQTLAEDVRRGVALEVETARRRLLAAREAMSVAERDAAYADGALKTLEDRYGSGLATNVAVLDAQTSREEADLRAAAARIAVAMNRAALNLAAGAEPQSVMER